MTHKSDQSLRGAAPGSQSTGTTADFAHEKLVQPQTVRKRYSATGSYFGIKPVEKLPNGRLKWPLGGGK